MTPGKQTVSASSTRSRRAAPGGAAPALLLVGLGLVATTGCEDDPLRLRVRVDAPRTLVPGEINAVRVSFAGSRGPCEAPVTCVPSSRRYDLLLSGEVPFYVDYLPGSGFRECVCARVEYLYNDTRKALREQCLPMPESGTVEFAADIMESCVSTPCSAAEPQCVLGICNVVRQPGVFADPPENVAPGATSCEVGYDGLGVED